MSPPATPFAERNGWRLYRASAFLASLTPLTDEVARLAAADPNGHAAHPKTKLLTRIR